MKFSGMSFQTIGSLLAIIDAFGQVVARYTENPSLRPGKPFVTCVTLFIDRRTGWAVISLPMGK